MQKVYLLLRSNQQTGPFSLEELLQFDLKPYDLIWIEGRSAGWYYPQEITALLPYLSFLKQNPETTGAVSPVAQASDSTSQAGGQKKIFVSLPSKAKSEVVSTPSFSSRDLHDNQKQTTSEAPLAVQPEELKTNVAKSLEEVETEYMNWAYQKKTKKKRQVSWKGALAACLLVSVAFASWKLLQPADKALPKTPPEQTAFLPSATDASLMDAPEVHKTPAEKGTESKKSKTDKKSIAGTTKKAEVVKQNVVMVLQEENAVVNASPQEEKEVVLQNTTATPGEERKAESVVVDAPKEKKKLRDKIADLFRKKPDEKKEEARPSEEENGERRSVRREAGSSLAQMVTVGFDIPNDWMMGIKGAKATLTNRSTETIAKAVVEVVYYNDDNDVLDKRTISFSNIKSKQKQTVSVPDHQTATRLEYNVISATGTGEPFAKR